MRETNRRTAEVRERKREREGARGWAEGREREGAIGRDREKERCETRGKEDRVVREYWCRIGRDEGAPDAARFLRRAIVATSGVGVGVGVVGVLVAGESGTRANTQLPKADSAARSSLPSALVWHRTSTRHRVPRSPSPT